MKTSREILILGASSYVGRHLFQKLGPELAIGTYNNTPIEHGTYFNACTMQLSDIIERPETITHAIMLLGDTDPETCAADIDKSNLINVDAIISLLKDLDQWNIKPIFTSSEFVFDGKRGNYTEDDPAHPILIYGQQKLKVEHFISTKLNVDWTIVRLAKVFGDQHGDGTLFTNWMSALETEKSLACAYDQIFSPIFIDDVVQAISRLLDPKYKGLYHLASHRAYTRIDLLNLLLHEINKHRSLDVEIIPCSIHSFELLEKRPVDVSMKPDKIVRETGLNIRTVNEICERIVRENIDRLPIN